MKRKYTVPHLGKFAVASVFIGALVLGIGLWKRQAIVATYADVTKPEPPAPVVVTKEQVNAIEKLPETVVERTLPKSFNLDVPFIKQAPHGVWDEVHNETCEEASILAVHAYYKRLKLSDDEMEAELQKMIAIQKKLFGYFEDTNVEKTVQFAKAAYKFSKHRVIENPTLDDIKKEIFAGRPVLFPANGKMLKNPNFRNGGPPYHFIVLRGWNEQGFFSNDPGTKKGENYYYTNAIVSESMHDWNETALRADGPRRILVLYE